MTSYSYRKKKIKIDSITLPNNENVSGSKIADSYVLFPPAEFKNHHKNYRLVLEYYRSNDEKDHFDLFSSPIRY